MAISTSSKFVKEIVLDVIKETGCFQHLYEKFDECVHMLGEREKKVMFIMRILSAVSYTSRENHLLRFRISAAKMACGKDPVLTNLFFQRLVDTVQSVNMNTINLAVRWVHWKGDRALYLEVSRAKAVIVKLQARWIGWRSRQWFVDVLPDLKRRRVKVLCRAFAEVLAHHYCVSAVDLVQERMRKRKKKAAAKLKEPTTPLEKDFEMILQGARKQCAHPLPPQADCLPADIILPAILACPPKAKCHEKVHVHRSGIVPFVPPEPIVQLPPLQVQQRTNAFEKKLKDSMLRQRGKPQTNGMSSACVENEKPRRKKRGSCDKIVGRQGTSRNPQQKDNNTTLQNKPKQTNNDDSQTPHPHDHSVAGSSSKGESSSKSGSNKRENTNKVDSTENSSIPGHKCNRRKQHAGPLKTKATSVVPQLDGKRQWLANFDLKFAQALDMFADTVVDVDGLEQMQQSLRCCEEL